MDIPRNKLIPVLGTIGVAIAGTVIYSHFRDDPAPVPAPAARGTARPADGDNANETLTTVVASNGELRKQIQAVLDQNANLKRDNDALRTSQEAVAAQARDQVLAQLRAEGVVGASAVPGAADVTPVDPAPPAKRTPLDRVGSAVDQAINDAGTLLGSLKTTPGGPRPAASHGIPAGLGYDGAATAFPSVSQEAGGVTTYKVVAPLGYDESKEGHDRKLVRKTVGVVAARTEAGAPRAAAAEPARLAAADGEEATPYFTIPENATMTRVTAMTAIVGRVPIDGRVTDPMQFKAVIGRENLAANGWDMPDDLSGIVVSGIAIGDMALSCSEGKVHSLTFVFADGSIRTVSTRKKNTTGGGAVDRPLGYLSDPWGNPCIAGKFVTNAPAYLTDVVGLRTLGVASRAYAAAQTTTTDSAQTGTSSTSVTGDRGAYVLGQAAAAGTDEVTNWVMSRLKNSFDAVVTPAGQKVVLHIDQQIDIDKAAEPRKLDHGRLNALPTAFGDRHGLD